MCSRLFVFIWRVLCLICLSVLRFMRMRLIFLMCFVLWSRLRRFLIVRCGCFLVVCL